MSVTEKIVWQTSAITNVNILLSFVIEDSHLYFILQDHDTIIFKADLDSKFQSFIEALDKFSGEANLFQNLGVIGASAPFSFSLRDLNGNRPGIGVSSLGYANGRQYAFLLDPEDRLYLNFTARACVITDFKTMLLQQYAVQPASPLTV